MSLIKLLLTSLDLSGNATPDAPDSDDHRRDSEGEVVDFLFLPEVAFLVQSVLNGPELRADVHIK